jgi:adenylate cyclase class 2
MKEIEVKVLEIDVKKVTADLKKLGAKKVFDGSVVTTYYDYPSRMLHKKGISLRTRCLGKKAYITWKSNVSKKIAKIRDEHECLVENIQVIETAFQGLGLKKVVVSRKHRISYALKNIHVDIDTYPCIPTFMEVEGKNVQEIRRFLMSLGFSMKNAKAWSGKEFFRYYQKKHYFVEKT